MSAVLEDKLEDVYKWYLFNRNNIAKENVMGRLQFQEKTIDCLFELVAILTQDMQDVEGARRKLLLPSGVTLVGDSKEFEVQRG
jgi:hypothetical protein